MQWRRRHFFPFRVTCNVKRSLFCIHVIGLVILVIVIFVICHLMWPLCNTGKRKSSGETVKVFHSQKAEANWSSLNTLKEAFHPSHVPHSLINLSSVHVDVSYQEVTGLDNSLSTNTVLFSEMRLGGQLITLSYPYLINEPDRCKGRNPFLIFMIAVEPENMDARNAIRQTWGNDSVAPGLDLVRLFLLGQRNDSDGYLQRSIRRESWKYHDIIQHAYQDTYKNLTIKTLMGMKWVANHCPHARYVMKTDSDMFVNTEYLIYKLLKPDVPPRQNYFTGYLMRGYAPNRNKDSKWYMPQYVYPSERYPVFCSGTGYVFSGDLAEKIYKVALSIPYLHLEDVCVGICLAKLHIEPMPPPNEFLFNHWRVSYSSCKYSHLVTSHQFKPNEIVKYWNDFQKNKHNPCNNAVRDRNRKYNP
ncbi:beta-1,3-galactosyltransferase 2 [Scleropages formosus]|uniref:Hexosyltransferase n=1 Tax=Scleropages formosus TaxID=113540 RepID=A0A8C9QVN5_SCLFO|nr:beta-1,3-galactosyltransferase 2-like [Scleropages formosus]XP_018609422.1 beta-1,3-galactosyltransferase 2-like [Scleropages formosus]XP_018609424.1 beta-1,3-galactosyltransferase 2-like [Scleropages formosus]XP_018609425.1 beta-1,3-galactosyltransferase 2-like [Scleropages formosus]XP_018609427.1 beta-1,3-galactosyltransferase 2-like [Scleropages formosus]